MIPLKVKKPRKTKGVQRPRYSCPSESAEQIAFIDWARVTNFCFFKAGAISEMCQTFKISEFLFAIANGGARNTIEAMRLKKEGVMPGVLDLEFMVPVHPYTGLFIEMKRNSKSAKVSPAQQEFIKKAQLCGRKCVVAYGFEEAKKGLLEYIYLEEIEKFHSKKL